MGAGSNTDGSGPRMFYSSNVLSRALGFFINNDGRIRSYLSNSGYQIFSTFNFNYGDWVHYVGTYAPVGATDTEHIMYLNAVENNSISTTSPSNGSGGSLALGSANDGRTPNVAYHRFKLYVSSTTVADLNDVNELYKGDYPASINSDLVLDFDFDQNRGDRHYSKVNSDYVDIVGMASGATDYGGDAWVDENQNTAK